MKSLRTVSVAVLGLLVLAATGGFTSGGPKLSWQLSDTGVTARFRGLAPVSDKVAWVAGSAGTILRTVDGGRTWQRVDPPGHGRAAVPRHRGVRRETRGRADHRRGRPVPAVRHLGRRPHLDGDVPQRRPGRLLRLRDVPRPPARPGPVRPGRRQVPDPGHLRRRPVLGGPADHRHAGRADRRVRVRGQRHLPGVRRPLGRRPGVVRHRRRRAGPGVRHHERRPHAGRVTDTPIPSGASAGIYSLAFKDPWHGIAVGGDYAVPDSAPQGRRPAATAAVPGPPRRACRASTAPARTGWASARSR